MDYSPTLAVGTAGFEIIAAGWAFALARRRRSGRRAIPLTTGLVLLLLAGYQLTEVAICADVGTAGFLPRLAFIIVTWLPALGLLLVAQIQQPQSRACYGFAFAMLGVSGGIVAWIALDPSFAAASVCNAVYARYAHTQPRFQLYAAYYWTGLLGMIALSGFGLHAARNPVRRRLHAHVLLGTLGFILPSIAVSYFVPETKHALPSILCHFALILALLLAHMLWVLRTAEEGVEAAESIPSGRRDG
jgi:hypothetical protein